MALSKGIKRLILLTTSLAAFQTPYNSTALSFIIPVLGRFFHASLYTLIYIPVVYLIPLPTLMILLGRIADIYGRVGIFRVGLVIFTIGSLMGALSTNVHLLIAASFIMGLGSAILSPSSTAIVSQVFPEGERGFALGINAMAVYIGLTSAPFLGGIITQFLGWRYILLISTMLSLIGLVVSYASMRSIEVARRGESLDTIGALTFSLALISIVMYLILSSLNGWLNYAYLLMVGVASLIVFILLEGRVKYPMLDLRLFTGNVSFMAGNVTALLNYISTYFVPFTFSLYLQVILGYNPFEAGLILVLEPIFMVILSPVSGRLSDVYGSREIAALGMGLIGLSFILLLTLNIRSIANILIALSTLGIGFGLFSAPNTNSVMSSVSRDKYGVASGVLGTMRFTGQLLSVTIAGSILTKYLGKYAVLYLFTGVPMVKVTVYQAFIDGLRVTLTVAAALSFLGVYTSLLRER
ncbi:MAG: MFS transporter [Caldivirga sp.]